jgi:AmiR/NasT family two-component response regulator
VHRVTNAEVGTASGAKTRVVVAEDEVLIRLDLVEMLTEEGYDVVGQAGDGETAVSLTQDLKPDLVVMDVKMPKMDGISAAEQIAGGRIAPVVMLTAFSQRELVDRARQAGAMAYVVKPFSKADLVPAIEIARARFAEIQAVEAEVSDLTERLDRAGGFPLDPEDGDGPAQVDARGRRGRHRARRRGQEEVASLSVPDMLRTCNTPAIPGPALRHTRRVRSSSHAPREPAAPPVVTTWRK